MTEKKTPSNGTTKNHVDDASELIRQYQALALVLCTVVFYIFSYKFLATYLADQSLEMQDYPFLLNLQSGYVIFYRVAEVTICVIYITIFYKLQKGFEDKAEKQEFIRLFFILV